MGDDNSGSTARPKCSVYIAASLDGFIARPDGGLDWLSAVERPGEDYGYKGFFDSVDALVIGRKTYDVVLGFEKWPYENKRCVVVTHVPPAPKHGETFHSNALPTLLAQLSHEGVRRIYVDGGALIRSFLAADLVDDVTLSSFRCCWERVFRFSAGPSAASRWSRVGRSPADSCSFATTSNAPARDGAAREAPWYT